MSFDVYTLNLALPFSTFFFFLFWFLFCSEQVFHSFAHVYVLIDCHTLFFIKKETKTEDRRACVIKYRDIIIIRSLSTMKSDVKQSGKKELIKLRLRAKCLTDIFPPFSYPIFCYIFFSVFFSSSVELWQKRPWTNRHTHTQRKKVCI